MSHPEVDELLKLQAERHNQARERIFQLSGADVQSVTIDRLVITVVPRPVEGSDTDTRYQLIVKFNSRTLDIEALELIPADVSVADLLFVSPNLWALHSLLSELQNRLHGHLRLQSEIAKLSKRFSITKTGEREIAVTFSTGTECHLRIGGDYPRPYASIYITHIKGFLPDHLANKGEQSRRVQGVTLKKLLKTISSGLTPVATS